MKANCAICGKEIEVTMCCSGHMCGCMGMPVEPPVCSSECYGKFMDRPKDLPGKQQKIDFDELLNT